MTKWTAVPGTNDRATDSAVAFDARHNVWLVSSLTLLETPSVHGNAVVTSRSTDGGFTWGNPVVTATGGDLDKNWIVCDNTASSAFYGNCYTQWDDHGSGNRLQMNRSTDGGLTWSAPATNNTGVIGGQPVVRPDGTVIVPIANANETAVGAFNSTNGGVSWSAVTTIALVNHHTVAGSLREGPLPSAEIDGAGTVYVAWTDCRFRRACKANDIVLSHSLNATGTSWSSVNRVPIDATNSGVDHFIPGLAVNKSTSGSTAQLGLTYYFYPSGTSQLNVGFISSTSAGSTWGTPQTILHRRDAVDLGSDHQPGPDGRRLHLHLVRVGQPRARRLRSRPDPDDRCGDVLHDDGAGQLRRPHRHLGHRHGGRSAVVGGRSRAVHRQRRHQRVQPVARRGQQRQQAPRLTSR